VPPQFGKLPFEAIKQDGLRGVLAGLLLPPHASASNLPQATAFAPDVSA
jgi:hypothetical protein